MSASHESFIKYYKLPKMRSCYEMRWVDDAILPIFWINDFSSTQKKPYNFVLKSHVFNFIF